MNREELRKMDLKAHQKSLDTPNVISRFLEMIADENNLDVQNVMVWYNKREGSLEVIEYCQPTQIITTIQVNDL